ncbi:uncharacterized protein LOC106665898 [Cimex lectularius]|uniref:Uncharacterized protein n=1 Tax=Cimex lectularius TaxID=79782 RepID=A0A8I6RNG6_CIMLE|nr:uncharacterized protein LOC106665898 [Cimex lectularius]
MAEYNFDTAHLPEAIQAMKENIQKKQEACALAEAEYVKYCAQFDASLKALQELKARRFAKENELRSSKFRIEECDKSSVEFYSKVSESKEIVEDLKRKMSEENLALRENDKNFKEDIIAMAERLCSYRETYDRTMLSEELKELCKENQLIRQELEDVRQCLDNLKTQFPLLPDPTVECVSKSLSKIRPCLEREIEELKSRNHSLQQRAKLLEANKSILMM